MNLPPYPEYKDSGLPWLDGIPSHWEVWRNGRLFSQRKETGFGELPILEVSLKTGVRVRDMDNLKRKQVMSDREKYKRAAKGDIAYNMMRMWQGAVGVAPADGLVSPAYVVAKPYPEVEPRYFSYLFRTDAYMNEVDGYSRGIVKDRNRLYWEDFKQMPSCVPPLQEQKAIADYLDDNAVKVSRFIRNRRKLIVLLNEQKQVISHRAVTRGLDPNVRLKPSGIPWLGDIPEHWEVRRFKTSVGFQEGPGIMLSDFREAGVPLLRISCLAGTEVTLAGCNYLSPEKVREKWSHFAVEPGDYLLSASGSTGAVRRVSAEVVGAIPYTGLIRLWPKSRGIDMEYLRLFMSARPFAEQISMAKSGVGIEHFGPTHLKRMWVLQPPVEEQTEIVGKVRNATAGIEIGISRLEREIELLREYRTRLVADVVTGKLDVRHLVPSEPIHQEEIGEEEELLEGIEEEISDDEEAEEVNFKS